MRVSLALSPARNCAVAKVALAGLLMSVALIVIVTARPALRVPTQAISFPKQMAFFGYWSEDNGFKSTVVLNNPSNIQVTVHPELYNRDGKLLAVGPITLEPRQQLTARIADWLAQGSVGDFNQGNLILIYDAPDALYLGAQVTVTNPASSLAFDFRDEMPMSFESSRLEGMWWQPDGSSRYDLVLSNMESGSVNVAVHASGQQGPFDNFSLDVALAPHQTQIINLDDKRLPFTISAGAGKLGGISITHAGAPGAVLAYGMLSKKQTGFSSHFTFEDPATSRSQVLAAAHLLIGKPDVSGFSEDVTFTSIAMLRNASNAPVDVKPSITFVHNGAPRTINIATRHLLAQQVDSIDIGAELKRAGIRGSISGAGLTLTSAGKPGTLVAHLTSYDQTQNHTFDIPLKDPAVAMNRFSGSYPWTLEGDTHSIVHIRNTSDEPSRYTIQLDWEGGSYTLPIGHLAPQQEASIDIRKLRDSQEKDSIGRVIPITLISGQANWNEHGKEALIGRSEVFSVSAGVASSFSCAQNCCLPSTVSVYMSPESMSGPVGGSGLMQLFEQRQRACDGAMFGPYNVTTSGTWSSNNTGVATTGSVTTSGCLVSCVGVGSCNIHADFNGISSTWDFVDGHCLTDIVPFPGNGGVTVPPSVSISGPNAVPLGTDVNTIQLTATGNPAGGSYVWSTTSSLVTLLTQVPLPLRCGQWAKVLRLTLNGQ